MLLEDVKAKLGILVARKSSAGPSDWKANVGLLTTKFESAVRWLDALREVALDQETQRFEWADALDMVNRCLACFDRLDEQFKPYQTKQHCDEPPFKRLRRQH